jgi:S1-C subfamily serine protease
MAPAPPSVSIASQWGAVVLSRQYFLNGVRHEAIPQRQEDHMLCARLHGWLALALLLISSAVPYSRAQTVPLGAAEIYKKASPAVVLIETYNAKGEVASAGSGFLVQPDGVIVTNYHVIAHTKQATVRLANQDAFDAVEVLDLDKRKDIAVIKIKAVGLPYLNLGQSSAVEVGQPIYSLSNPLGLLQNTLSEGIVSGIRQGDGYRYFQITAPISHGSSGSPIFDSSGKVIGIAVSTIEEGQNLNFAVPIDYASGMLSSLGQPRPLESIYEPEPDASASAAASKQPATSEPTVAVLPQPSEDMKKGSFVYVGGKIGRWTDKDAARELGPAVRHRPGYDNQNRVVISDIFAYADPTRAVREFELSFDNKTSVLTNVFGYPWDMTWDQCKQLWGTNARTVRNPDGTHFHLYRDRHLNVLTNKDDKVISLGVY